VSPAGDGGGNVQISVFLVDDSAVSRMAFRKLIQQDSRLRVVGEANDGEEALRKIPEIKPDVVLMDIVMPGMDGMETTRELMHHAPCPILIISDQVGGNVDPSFEALRAGALEVIGKPTAGELSDPSFAETLLRKIRLLSDVPVITRYRTFAAGRRKRRRSSARPTREDVKLLCIGASTGGPPVLQRLLGSIPRTPKWPTLIVQHMTPGFTAGMASWLGKATGRQVEMATSGTRPEPGVVYVAPDAYHLELLGRCLRLSESPPVAGHRPSVDALFASVASTGPAHETVAVVLTGMGRDGAAGLKLLREAGAWTIAQDRISSVVYGMPKAAAEIEAACESMSVDELAIYLASLA
jgi:two-component system chemotaxis response regulator CheB